MALTLPGASDLITHGRRGFQTSSHKNLTDILSGEERRGKEKTAFVSGQCGSGKMLQGARAGTRVGKSYTAQQEGKESEGVPLSGSRITSLTLK